MAELASELATYADQRTERLTTYRTLVKPTIDVGPIVVICRYSAVWRYPVATNELPSPKSAIVTFGALFFVAFVYSRQSPFGTILD